MIKKIIEILNVGRFSSLRPENGSESDFVKFNVIYAESRIWTTTTPTTFMAMVAMNTNKQGGNNESN